MNHAQLREQIRASILQSIQSDPRFVGCVDYGSTSEGRGDEWSDLDMAFFVQDEHVDEINQHWKEWASQFGNPLLMFAGAENHPWAVFDAHPLPLRADFAFHPESNLDIILDWPNAPTSVEAMVLYDATNGELSQRVGQIVGQDLGPTDLREAFENICGSYWYYLLRLEGRIHRNELMAAAWQLNFIIVANLCALLKIEHGDLARFRSSDSTAGIEKIITPRQLRGLKRCVAGPDIDELRRAMLEAAQLGSEVCIAISQQHGWLWPQELAHRVVELNRQALNSRDVAELYDKAASTYSEAIKRTNYIVPSWLEAQLQEIELPTAPVVLDLGCANGINALQIREIYPQVRLMGLDISPMMVEEANKTGIYEIVKVHDLSQSLGFVESGYFDLVVAFGCLEFVTSLNVCLNELSRVLKPAGQWMASFQLYVPGRENAPRNMRSGVVVHHAYTEAEIKEMLDAAGLEPTLMEEVIGYTGGVACPYLMVRGHKTQSI